MFSIFSLRAMEHKSITMGHDHKRQCVRESSESVGVPQSETLCEQKLPIYYASANGHIGCFNLILQQINPDERIRLINESLCDAAENNQAEMVKYLIEQGADVNWENDGYGGYSSIDLQFVEVTFQW